MTAARIGSSAGGDFDLISRQDRGVVCTPSEKQTPEEEVTRQWEASLGQSGPERGQQPGRPLTLGEAALYLNVSERYMRRLVAERRVTFLKVGRLLRFRPGDLDAYLDSCVVDGVARR